MSITGVRLYRLQCDECGLDYDVKNAQTHLEARKEAHQEAGWTWYMHAGREHRFVRDLCRECSTRRDAQHGQ